MGAGFTAVCQQLIAFGADEKVIEIATEAIRDEVHHAQIAVALAARYRGDAERWPAGQDTTVPLFAPAEGILKATLFVTAMCCINETLACSVLEAQLLAAKSPLARAGYQSVLSDEIDHGRMGWAHLSSSHVPDDIRRQIGDWLPRLFQARLGELFDPHPLPGEHLTDHGILRRRARQQVIGTGVLEVVLPGFKQIGVNPEKGYAWAKENFGPCSKSSGSRVVNVAIPRRHERWGIAHLDVGDDSGDEERGERAGGEDGEPDRGRRPRELHENGADEHGLRHRDRQRDGQRRAPEIRERQSEAQRPKREQSGAGDDNRAVHAR